MADSRVLVGHKQYSDSQMDGIIKYFGKDNRDLEAKRKFKSKPYHLICAEKEQEFERGNTEDMLC